LRATFESPLELSSPAHPLAENGVIQVEPGDRLPGIPTHSFKAGVTVRPLDKWEIGMSMIAQSDRPYRGDEANLLKGVQGHAVFGASTSYQVLRQLQIFLKAENVFDAEYESYGLLGEPDDVLEGAEDPRFQSPGAPLGIWGGLVLRD
jgi:outer membrane receptor protein involved in Fe transport